jgi:pimeloyl-ACP methyl ester carboxylesterase
VGVLTAFFLLPSAIGYSAPPPPEAPSFFPIQKLSPQLSWQGNEVNCDDELSVNTNKTGEARIDFAISDSDVRNQIGAVATGTYIFVDVYKGNYKDSSLYESYSYSYDGSGHKFSIQWDQPGRYFIAVYAENNRSFSGEQKTEFYAKMRPWFTEGDDSAFEPRLTLLRNNTRVHAESNQEIILWGKTEFTVTETKDRNPSVAFLPGFQASRLYTKRPSRDRLWEPGHNDDLREMSFTVDGESEQGIEVGSPIDTVKYGPFRSGSNIYADFFTFLDDLKADELISDWKALPYDWRRNQSDVVQSIVSGVNASSTYDMISRIEKLADNSASGEVTLIGHSNGGLVGKLLISELEKRGKSDVINKFVMVGTPQVGTPKSVGALLHGLDQQYLGGLVAQKQTARTLARNMPGMYGLLPSPTYFQEVKSPIVEFDSGQATEKFRKRYGTSIDSYQEFRNFLIGKEGREAAKRINQPLQANPGRLSDYQSSYNTLSRWQAPTSTDVTQIVGRGLPTVKALRYFDKKSFCLQKIVGSECESEIGVKPVFTKQGDKTVVQSSADQMASEDYFLLLKEISESEGLSIKHSNITESSSFQETIKKIIIDKNVVDTPTVKNKKPDDSGLEPWFN